MSYQLLLTNAGAQKFADATNLGLAAIHITDFAVGQGAGIDFSTRLDKQTLVSKRYQGKVESVAPVTGRPNQYEINCVVPADVGGFTIREMGLIDSDGVLVWVGSLPEVQKPTPESLSAVDYRLKAIVQIENPTVQIVIDANAMTATHTWVNANFVSKPQFANFLALLFPYGYKYWSHLNQNPKPLFDAIFGYETFWRRLEGVQLVAVQDSDPFINQPMLNLGQKGLTDAALSMRPHTYPLYTSYLFERYDPGTVVNTIWQVSASKNPLPEGDSLQFIITANNIPDGQILNWTIGEGDGMTTDQSANGTTILQHGKAIIDYNSTADDNLADPNKQVRLQVGLPANLDLIIPITDKGHHETVIHISQSTYDGIVLDEYFKEQAGHYPSATDNVRFIVDSGVDIVAPSTLRGAIESGSNWADGSSIIVENHGRIMGRGGDGGTNAVLPYPTLNIQDTNQVWESFPLATGVQNITPAQKGTDGGIAINAGEKPLLIDNYNLIASGGGGGGGAGLFITYPLGFAAMSATDHSGIFKSMQVAASYVGRYDTYGTSHQGGFGGAGGGAPFGRKSDIPPLGNPGTGIGMANRMDVGNNQFTVDPEYKQPGVEFHAYQYSTDATVDVPGQYGYAGRYWYFDIEHTRLGGPEGRRYYVNGTTRLAATPDEQNAEVLRRVNLGLSNLFYLTQLSHGGRGGNVGENGEDGVMTLFAKGNYWMYAEGDIVNDQPTENYGYNDWDFQMVSNDYQYLYASSQPAQGGQAGYIYQGNVIINNINGGVTKGRTP